MKNDHSTIAQEHNDSLVFLVVTHNGERHIRNLLDSLPAGSKVVIVDNASTDGTRKIIEDYKKIRQENNTPIYHILTPIYCPQNRGYAAGINAGMKAIGSSAQWVFVLNQDTVLPKNFQLPTTNDQENKKHTDDNPIYQIPYTKYHPFAVVQPRILLPNGNVNVDELVMNIHGFVFPPDYDTPPKPKEPKETILFSGAAFLLNVEKYRKIGPFDESFFMYYEEVDYALKIRQAGEKILLDPTWSVTHHYARMRSWKKIIWQIRNRSRIMRRYASPLHQLLTFSALPRKKTTHKEGSPTRAKNKNPIYHILNTKYCPPGFPTRQFPLPIRLLINTLAIPLGLMVKGILAVRSKDTNTKMR